MNEKLRSRLALLIGTLVIQAEELNVEREQLREQLDSLKEADDDVPRQAT